MSHINDITNLISERLRLSVFQFCSVILIYFFSIWKVTLNLHWEKSIKLRMYENCRFKAT